MTTHIIKPGLIGSLHLIEALPDHERTAVCGALHALSMVDRPVLTDSEVDWREKAEQLETKVRDLDNEAMAVQHGPAAEDDE